MNNDDQKAYETGYKKPPKNNQFRPGQSGNPKGRPRGAKNFSTAIEKELRTRIAITENGKRKVLSKREVVAKRTVNNAVEGDHKSTALLIGHDRMQQAEAMSAAAPPQIVCPEDKLVMEDIIRRIRQPVPESRTPDSGDHEQTTPTSQDQGEEH